MSEPINKPPSLPAGAETALQEVEDAHIELRAAALRLELAVANLQALVVIEQVRQD